MNVWYEIWLSVNNFWSSYFVLIMAITHRIRYSLFEDLEDHHHFQLGCSSCFFHLCLIHSFMLRSMRLQDLNPSYLNFLRWLHIYLLIIRLPYSWWLVNNSSKPLKRNQQGIQMLKIGSGQSSTTSSIHYPTLSMQRKEFLTLGIWDSGWQIWWLVACLL